MAIKINLLAEAQAQEEMRRKDPVKRAVWVAAFVIFLMLLWASKLYFEQVIARSQQQNLESTWKGMEKQYNALAEDEKSVAEMTRKIDSLNRYSTNRFLWGSTLNAFQQAIPPALTEKLQLIHIGSSFSYLQTEGVAAKKTSKGTIPAKPATATEKITITVDGKDYGGTAEQNFNRFKTSLANQPYIKGRVPVEQIVLKSVSQPSTDSEQRQYIIFTLEMQFPPVTREESK